MDEPSTNKQQRYIYGLVKAILEPLFEFSVKIDDSLVVAFLNENYSDWLSAELTSLSDLEKHEATEILHRLEEGLD